MTVWHRFHLGWFSWLTLAGFLTFINGFLHFLYGIGVMSYHTWYLYTGNLLYLFEPETWGWILIIGGGLFLLSSMFLYRAKMPGIIVGGILAVLSIIANIALLAAAPFWSAIAINIDLLIIYALAIHGAEIAHHHY